MLPLLLSLFLTLQSTTDPKAYEWYRKGEELIGTPQENSAQQAEFFAKAVEADPKFAVARFNLGLVYLQLNQIEQARSQFAAFAELQPQDPRGYFLAARADLQLQRPDQALEMLQKGLQAAPDDPEGWGALAHLHYNQGRYAESLQASMKVLQLPDPPPDSYFLAALAHYQLGQHSQAIPNLRAFLSHSPEDYQAHHLTGMIYLEEGDKEAALRHLLKAESLDRSDPQLAQILGELLLDQGRDEEAAQRLQRADPESAANLANLGIIAVKQERFAEAEKLLRRSLAQEPTQALLWGYLADALVGQKKAIEALAAYDQALRYDPDDLKSLITAGTLAADHERPEQALGYLKEALKRAPEDGYVHYGMALVMERLGDPDGAAQQHYLRALELGEDRPNAHFRLTYLFARQSEKEKALEHLEAALEKDSERFYPHLMNELRQIRSDLDSIRYTPQFAELLAKNKPEEQE